MEAKTDGKDSERHVGDDTHEPAMGTTRPLLAVGAACRTAGRGQLDTELSLFEADGIEVQTGPVGTGGRKDGGETHGQDSTNGDETTRASAPDVLPSQPSLRGTAFGQEPLFARYSERGFHDLQAIKEFRDMTARQMMLRPAGSEPKRRGRPSKAESEAQAQARQAVALLAGLDALTVSSQGRVSAELYGKLREAKEIAKHAEHSGSVHYPEWLSAQVKPKGDRGGGHPYLIETEDFTVKVAGEAQTMWPGLVIELRSHFLHAHPSGARRAVEEALCWTRDQLLYNARESDRQATTFEQVSVSRVDLHIDWQGGFVPSYSAGEERRFIRPRRTLWHPFNEGNTCQGYRFGSGKPLMARLYNKTAERKKRHDESYSALLQEHTSAQGIPYVPETDVWRLEFELHREAVTSLKLAPESDAEDTDADIEAELSAEELPHVGTLPKLFAHLGAAAPRVRTARRCATTPA
jgi:hypothetical protein